MRNRFMSLVLFPMATLVFSSAAVAQVYFPPIGVQAGGPSLRRDANAAAAATSKTALVYDPHDLSGIWSGGPSAPGAQALMGGSPAPPMTAWAQELFDARKPSGSGADPSRKVPPAQGNDPLGKCDPLGYPRGLEPSADLGTFEIFQTPDKILQIFQNGRRLREIWTDGRKLPADLDPRWYGWAVGHWEGDSLVVDSTGYDERTWLNGNGLPHSEDMKLHEVYRHPDAVTLELTMTLDDPKAYTKTWVGRTQTFKQDLPKGLTVLDEWFCASSEEQSFNERIRNPAGGQVSK
jgi:hypothetical protein